MAKSHSFSELAAEPDRFVRELQATGDPIIIELQGSQVVIQDAASYSRIVEELERAEAVAGIRRGLDDMYAGRTKPLDQAFARIRRSE